MFSFESQKIHLLDSPGLFFLVVKLRKFAENKKKKHWYVGQHSVHQEVVSLKNTIIMVIMGNNFFPFLFWAHNIRLD